ncbi:hypothetical protein HH310_04245 [Actinoplanes sp. TBRC 11911]|uniref:hypothetical protein n=1 Tax=Actinoplanes sp. TBRC 11911 TaxID=2729386 RepID=UPI00145D96CB|nr:hypothetical protein [Actinoplanes sp. TBRC 11911]NMO50402.1 hypothetical protein [Actinoplanes sp. TBRC 11911]
MQEAPPMSVGSTVRLVLGWAFAALGVLNLSMGVAGGGYLLFHVVLLVTAVALMGFGRIRRQPGRIAWLAAGAVPLLGLVLSTLPAIDAGCCLRDRPGRHGFPFTMYASGRVDAVLLVSDLVFWSSVGFLVLTALTLLRPPLSPPAATNPTHAEGRATEVPAPRDESVGGLP